MNSNPAENPPNVNQVLQAVVGVAMRDDRFLVIRRSRLVRAPFKLCLPGGQWEPGESQSEAVVRELHEELNLVVQPQRLIWSSVSPWGTELFWWSIRVDERAAIVPNPAEVESYAWMSSAQLLSSPALLESAADFLRSYQSGQVAWP